MFGLEDIMPGAASGATATGTGFNPHLVPNTWDPAATSPAHTDGEPGGGKLPAHHPMVIKSNPVTFLVITLGIGIAALLYGLDRI